LQVDKGILASGVVRRKSDGGVIPFHMELLGTDWLGRALALQTAVLRQVKEPGLVVSLSADEFERMLGPEGKVVGVLAQERLIGLFGVYFPGSSEENLARDLDMPPTERLRAFHMEIAYVDPDFQGNGLQKQMMAALVGRVARGGAYRWALATIDPRNLASLVSAFGLKLLAARVMPKYGGLLRYIMVQDVARPIAVDAGSAVEVPIEDVERQQDMFAHGYVGYQIAGGSSAGSGGVRILLGRAKDDRWPPQRRVDRPDGMEGHDE